MEKEEAGEEKKTLRQIIIFLLVSSVTGIIQLVLVNVLFYFMRDWKEPLPLFLKGVFSASSVGAGNDNWGYVLPFFLSNLLANIYGYFRNKKTTFKSDAPPSSFAAYIGLMVLLILFSTWLQGVVANALLSSGSGLLVSLAPTVAAAAAGTLQMLILFPVEKFVLLRERRQAAE